MRAPYENPRRAILLVELCEAGGGSCEVVETTANHPFYVEGRGWTRVDEMAPGDVVPGADAALVVASLAWTERVETVYNFGVDEFRSYLVGELGAWVHNCDELIRKVNGLPKDAKLTSNVEDVFRRLEVNNGLDRNEASKILHDIKSDNGFGGADNVVFDRSGTIYNPNTGEVMGRLIPRRR